jgi:hypothetical protein
VSGEAGRKFSGGQAEEVPSHVERFLRELGLSFANGFCETLPMFFEPVQLLSRDCKIVVITEHSGKKGRPEGHDAKKVPGIEKAALELKDFDLLPPFVKAMVPCFSPAGAITR